MPNIITLDGLDFTEDCMEIQQIDSLVFSLDDTSKIVDKTISSDFTFRRAAYDYILDKFFGDVDTGCDYIMEVVITLDCCTELSLDYELTNESVVHCPETCEMQTVLTRLDSDIESFNFLNRNRLFDGDILNTTSVVRRPHLSYCDGSFTGFGALLYNILASILGLVNLIPGVNIDIPFALKGLLGCNKLAPGFVIPDLLNYWATAAGLTFQSETIYDLANYDKSTMIAMQFEPGEKNECPNLSILEQNRPNINVIDFIGRLAPLYDGKCRIRNGVLLFENAGWIDDNMFNVGDVADQFFEPLKGICYSYNLDADYAAYARMAYTYDSVDRDGNRVAPIYNDIIEWNPDGLDSRRGEFNVQLIDFTPLFTIGMLRLFIGGIDNQSPELGFLGFSRITDGQASQWKIYQWDGASECFSKPIPPEQNFPFSSTWNFPYFFKQIEEEGDSLGLYDTFYDRKKPDNLPCPMKADDFEFVTDDFCGMIDALQIYGTDIYLDSPFGKITPTSVRVDLDKKSFTWSDTRIIKP